MTAAPEDSARHAGQDWQRMERAYQESPLHRLMGLRLRIEAAGLATVSLLPGPELGNRNGTVSGGVLGTMVDSAVVQAVRTLTAAGTRAWTQDMKVNFVRRARIGAALTASGRVEHLGRSTAVGIGRVCGADGVLLAVGVVTVVLVSGEEGERHDRTHPK